MRRYRTVLAALALAVTPGSAYAQATEVATARQLAISGIDLVEAGNCEKGEPLLRRAEDLHHASVHLQYLARCRAAAGRLVAATEMWRRIVRDGAPSSASPAVRKALAEAMTQLAQTLPRLASTTIRATKRYPGLALTIDGTSIDAEIVGAAQVLDPGDHELSASAPGYATWSRRWSLAEGGTAEVVIDLVPLPSAAPAPPDHEALPAAPPAAHAEAPPFAPVGWVTASVGAAALVAGTVTLLSHDSRLRELNQDCPAHVCPRDVYTPSKFASDTGTIRDLMTASNVLLIGGSVLLAGGVTLIVIGNTGRAAKGSGDGGPGRCT